jgi:hypothetical protein
MTTTPERLKNEGKCRTLAPEEADKIFFPTSGGKPTEAKKLCASCSLEALCLAQAIEKGLQGFWAGTTDKERAVMAARFHVKVQPLEAVIETPKRIAGKIFRSKQVQDTLAYLDTLKGPAEEELAVVSHEPAEESRK